MCEVGQELIKILLDYGFVENTKSVNPEHYNTLQKSGEYNPFKNKRYFKKGRIQFYFDYINIHITYNCPGAFFSGYSISIDQLTSILYFSDLPSNDRQYFYKHLNHNSIHQIYEYLYSSEEKYLHRQSAKVYLLHKEHIGKLKEKVLLAGLK